MDTRITENLNGIQQDYIAPFLWLQNEPDEEILKTLDKIYDCGVRSVCLESRTHEEFCREDWWSDVKLIFEECKKKNMKVWILDDKHYPSGYANGIFEEKYKHLQSFGITETHIDVAGPVKDGSAMVDCWLESEEDSLIAIAACKHIPNSDKYSEVIDITDGYSDGMVYFDLPQGMWRIVFMVKTRRGTHKRHLPFCDMLNPKTIDLFIEEVYEAHYERFSEYFGNTFMGFFSDEPSFLINTHEGFAPTTAIGEGMPFAHFPWRDGLLEDITDNRGEFAGLWYDIEGVSDRIKYDYMDRITKEYSRNFCQKIGAWCKDHNVLYIGHIIEDNHYHCTTGNGPGHYFRSMDGQDMSGVDVVLHQIIPGLTECSNSGYVAYQHMNNDFFHYYLGKLGSSCAHIDPRKKGRAMCEIFGAYGWAEGTKIMKYLMDHMLVRGINYYVPHAFSTKANDTETPPNFYDAGSNPQFKYFKNSMRYMNRMCHILSDGKHISCCAILYDGESRWLCNDFVPLEKIGKKLYDNLYDYDIIPADYLDKLDENSCINGEKYNLLIVPFTSKMAKTIKNQLKNANIDIVVVSENGERLDDCPFESVKLDELIEYLNGKKLYDVRSDYNGIYLRYYHYTRNGAHIYMFNNEDINNTIKTTISLSAFGGGKYIEYEAFDNRTCVKKSDNSEIEIELEPYHSKIISFGDVDYTGIDEYTLNEYGDSAEIQPVFKISVAPHNSENFEDYKVTDKLFNVTGKYELPNFSGHIKYEAEIKLENSEYLLDLGYVGEAVEVYINDEKIGEKQVPPYTFEIKNTNLKPCNRLTVIVSNHNGFERKDRFSKYLLFEPSGLLGPVKISKKLS